MNTMKFRDEDTAAEALRYIVKTVNTRGFPPTFRELGQHVGIESSSTAQKLVQHMVTKGWIAYDPTKPRTIKVTTAGAKVVGQRQSKVDQLQAEIARLRHIILTASAGDLSALEKV